MIEVPACPTTAVHLAVRSLPQHLGPEASPLDRGIEVPHCCSLILDGLTSRSLLLALMYSQQTFY
jgi:hypothetical protein